MPKFILMRVETQEKDVECETYEDAVELLYQQEWGSMSTEIEMWALSEEEASDE